MTSDIADRSTYRRNFILISLNGIISMGAYALFDPVMVLTAFIVKTNGSEILVGLAGAIAPLAISWPQIFVANLVQSKPRRLFVYRWAAVGRVLTHIVLAALMWHYRAGLPWWFSYAFLGLLFVHWSITGIAQVPFMDTIGKAVRPSDRPVLFAWRQSAGMVLSLLSGVFIAWVLSDDSGLSFPDNYLVALLLMTVGVAIGLTCFALVKEPVEMEGVSPRLPWREHFMKGPRILRDDANYRRLLIGFFSFSVSLSALPFLVPFLIREVGMSDRVAGPLMMMAALGSIGMTAYFGWLGRRRGNRKVVVLASRLGIIVPGLSLAAALSDGGMLFGVDIRFVMIAIAVVAARLATSGMNMGRNTFLLDIASPVLRPTYTSFWMVFVTFTSLIPIGVGVLIQNFGYDVVFGTASVFGLFAMYSFTKLAEPRDMPGHAEGNTGPNVPVSEERG